MNEYDLKIEATLNCGTQLSDEVIKRIIKESLETVASYTGSPTITNFSIKVNESGKVLWNHFAPLFSLKEEHYGKEIRLGSRMFKLTGINPQRMKYPISAVDIRTGKGFKLSKESVLKSLGIVPCGNPFKIEG